MRPSSLLSIASRRAISFQTLPRLDDDEIETTRKEQNILRRKKKGELSRETKRAKGIVCNNRFHSSPRTKGGRRVCSRAHKDAKKRKSVSDETNASDFLVEIVYDEWTGGKMIGISSRETNERTKEKAC